MLRFSVINWFVALLIFLLEDEVGWLVGLVLMFMANGRDFFVC
jgi:hypothetical protein